MKLTVVGCSGSYAGPESAASCYLLQVTDERSRPWNIVLDLGSGAFGALQRFVEPVELDAVALTHLHADHVADVSGLDVYRRYHPMYSGRCLRAPLLVLGPAETPQRFAALCGERPVPDPEPAFALAAWNVGEPVRIGPVTITPYKAWHPIEAYCLRIEGPSEAEPGRNVILAFSGDTALCDGLIEAASGADLLLCEAAFVTGRDDAIEGLHLTGSQAGAAATRAGARRLALTHIPAWNTPGVALAEARQSYAGEACEVTVGQQFVL
ncbi:MBL fold metallo-hydrolase [Rarobacter incanus]|uniref:Ribonuclease BN (tRNA processing enzyme) n=1 Tax=Rarobacter incanus TaxID=153494 RepID=A0A542SRS3_9MICO|nr:MBL fold metallo-hydrolase [Rarobacter incanus]TQK77294.1 ribonuclease BN (tRNA processing enzyme) [Rarobacter incanus]